MNKTKNFIKDYLWLFSGISIFYFFLFVYFFKTGKPFVLCNDQLFQYDIFYREWFRLISEFLKGNGLPMYSWNLYLGGDFYSSMTYYCTGDVFVILLYPLSLIIHNVKHLLTLEIVACTYLSSFSFYMFLKKKGLKNKTVINVASIIYALGGWGLSFIGNYMFHRFYAFLPLLFLGVELYYQSNKTFLVSISVAILFMQNFYMMYPTSIFLFLYCLCKEFCLSKEERRNRIFKDIGRLVSAYLIGTFIAAIILIPAILSVLSNSRVGEVGESGLFWQVTTYIHLLLSPISSPFPTFSIYNDIYFLHDGGHGFWFFIYIGIVYFISAISYILHKKNRPHLILSICLLAIMIFKPLSSIMHGFSEASFRWLFLVVLYLLTIGSEELEGENAISNNIFYVYMAMVAVSIVVLIAMGFSIIELKEHFAAIVIYVFASIFLWLCFIKNRKIGLILSACEILCLGFINIHLYNVYGKMYDRINRNDVAYYANIDEDLIYRYYISWEDITPTALLDLNKPMDYGFMSSKTYNSMYDNVTNRFNYLNDNYRHFIDITNPYSLNMLGTKYWIAYDETFLPTEFDFEYVYDLSDLKVYKNLNYKGFGYTQRKIDYLDNINELKDFEDTIFVDNNSFVIPQSNREYARFNVTEKGNNSLKGNIAISDKNILFIPIPNNPGWKVSVNGQKIETISVNGGFVGIELEAGYNEVEMYFVSPGFKAGSIISLAGLFLFVVCSIKEKNSKI